MPSVTPKQLTDAEAALLARVDHTLLSPAAAWPEIQTLCDEGIAYGVASVCIPPTFVCRAADYLAGRLPVCTVIGFPNGYHTADVKAFETRCAVADGAGEIDMVINIGAVKEGRYDTTADEIRAVRAACPGKILKVIIETCLLTEDEKVRLTEIVADSGAEYIKTSTGFSTGGATPEDIRLFAAHRKNGLKIKAAGGIRTLADAELFLSLGADRLGTSRIVRLIQARQAEAENR